MIYFSGPDYFKEMISLGYVPSHATNDNAEDLLKAVNLFLSYLFRQIVLPEKYEIVLTSGWRSIPYNEDLIKRGYRASKTSYHCVGRAIDIKGQEIIKACEKDNSLLERFGLYGESSLDTAERGGWSHVQNLPPRSGHRIFRA